MLIFLHLPKTAGQTLVHIMKRQYGPDAVLSLYSSSFGEELRMMPRQQTDTIRLIIGHLYFGVHSFFPGLSIYLTMLRDPVDRIISHYYFVRSNPTHYLYSLAQQTSLAEFIVSCNRLEPNNDQTRLLAGKDYLPDSGECTQEMLPMAKKNLQEHFSVVGLTEEFDVSLLLFKHILNWKTPFYVRRNVTRQRPRKEEISKKTLAVIEQYNKLDMELYHYGKAIFQQQLHALEPAIKKELRVFQALNGSFNQVYRLMSTTAGRIGLR